jgi:hypothetical protein
MLICCGGSVFTAPLPGNDRLFLLNYSCFHSSCHNIILLFTARFPKWFFPVVSPLKCCMGFSSPPSLGTCPFPPRIISPPPPRFSFRHLNGKVSILLLKKCCLQHGYFSRRLNFNFKSKISAGKKSISALFCSLCNNTAYGLQSEFPENEIRKRERRLMIL